MVSGAMVLIVLVSVAVILTGIFQMTTEDTNTGKSETRIQKYIPGFTDFSLSQKGDSISIQNTGIAKITAKSLKIYFGSALLNLTNMNDIEPGYTYAIDTSELPSFEVSKNITFGLGDMNKSIRVQAIFSPYGSFIQNIPRPSPGQTSTETTATYSLDIRTTGNGTTLPIADTYYYDSGSYAEIKAVPYGNSTFSFWRLDGESVYNTTAIIKMDRDHSLQAIFTPSSYLNCTRANPKILLTNATPPNNNSMIYNVNIANQDQNCGPELFSLIHYCPYGFRCNFQNPSPNIDSNSSTTINFYIMPLNASTMYKGSYYFQISAINRANAFYSEISSGYYLIQ